MDLSTYQTITGLTVASSDQARVTAQINRSRRTLESLLGYSLTDPQVNLYNELGKTTTECACPIVDTEELEDPDPVVGAYRLYDYDIRDEYFHVDPFRNLHKVKLVYIRQGSAPNGITVKTFDADETIEHQGRDPWSKYIQEYTSYFRWHCLHSHYLQLAVDADWEFETVPDDLLDLWAEMVTYESDCNRDIKSESILTHSYSKLDRGAPEGRTEYSSLLSRYAGPHGTLSRTPVI